MERLVTSNLKLGIIAGGQPGKMLIREASKCDIISYVLDAEEIISFGGGLLFLINHFQLRKIKYPGSGLQ